MILFAVNFIAATGVNIWGLSNIFEREKNQSQNQMTSEEWKAQELYLNYYQPTIDSLLDTNPQLAIEYTEKIIKKYPNEYYLHIQKGVGFFEIDSFQLAYSEFKKSMKVSGYEFPKGQGYSGWALAKLGRYDEAIVELKKAAESNYDYEYDLAQIYELSGDYKNAIHFYNSDMERMKKLNPFNYKEDIKFIENKIVELENKKE